MTASDPCRPINLVAGCQDPSAMTPAYYGFKGAKFGGTFKATVTDRQLQLVDAESQDSLVRRETSPWGRGTCAERSGDLGTA